MGSVQEKHLQVCESEEAISVRRISRLASAEFAFFARLCSTSGTADCEYTAFHHHMIVPP
jgi:hypothetical protein